MQRLAATFTASWLGKPSITASALFAILLLVGCAAASARGESHPDLIQLDSGPIFQNEDGIYLGIPYAHPPTGAFRWRAPQPVVGWTEARRFDEPGPICPQPSSDDSMSEDCLTLNIWTPARSRDAKLPVMVWIHGGAFMSGSGSDELYDGAALSKKGVVLVTFNYRLGPLGFLAHPLLSAESPDHVSGNYGLMDQLAALKWVQRNIGCFGGDPEKVTVFGESAGAESVSLLLLSPLASGLFRSAIAQSPVMVGSLRPLRAEELKVVPAETVGTSIVKALGIEHGPNELAALRGIPWQKIDEAASGLRKDLGVEILGMVCTPTVDGFVIPDHPVRLLRQGRRHPVPLITGITSNESTVFLPLMFPSEIGPNDYRKYVETAFSSHADKILQLVPIASGTEIRENLDRLVSARWFGAWANGLARDASERGSPTWFYRFTRKPPSWAAEILLADSADADISAEKLGVPHAAELFSVFGFTPILLDFDEEDRAFSERVITYWTNFAKTGDPNGSGLPGWPRYDSGAQGSYMELGAGITPRSGLDVDLFSLVEMTWMSSAY